MLVILMATCNGPHVDLLHEEEQDEGEPAGAATVAKHELSVPG